MATVKEIITNAEGKMHKSVDALRVDLASLRAGRATPSLLEKVMGRSWETTSTVFSKLDKYSSSHITVSRSRSLVGSSRSRLSGFPNKACANSTRTFSLPLNSFINLQCNSSLMPRPESKAAASLSAFQPSISANISSSSDARMPSSSVKSSFAQISSFSFFTAQSFS